jgi:hypothetical protein
MSCSVVGACCVTTVLRYIVIGACYVCYLDYDWSVDSQSSCIFLKVVMVIIT